jgi:hypothetical protein
MESAMQSAATVNGRNFLWFAVLAVASVLFSLHFACATPFAAFAALAAVTLNRRDTALLMVTVWFVNQVVGYFVLNYPQTANSYLWGLGLGFAGIFTALIVERAAARCKPSNLVEHMLAAFFLSFFVWQGILFAIALLLGGTQDFTAAILSRSLALNGLAFLGLFLLNWVGAQLGFAQPVKSSHA